MARHPPGEGLSLQPREVAAGAARLSVAVRGAGRPVLAVPSQGRSVADFDDLADRLVAAGFKVILAEPRGVGPSRGPADGVTMHDLAADAAAVIEACGDGPADVIGHAFGNRVARMLASDRPDLVRRVVLLAAGGMAPVPDDVMRAFELCFQVERGDAERLPAIATVFFAAGNDPSVWLGGWWPEARVLQTAANAATPVADWWDAGSAPLLVVQGLADRMAPPANGRMLKDSLGERVTLVELENASHALLPERPDAIARAVIGFLAASPPTGAE